MANRIPELSSHSSNAPRLARAAWDSKDALETRWWCLVFDGDGTAFTVRNGCDCRRRARFALDDAPAVFPWRA